MCNIINRRDCLLYPRKEYICTGMGVYNVEDSRWLSRAAARTGELKKKRYKKNIKIAYRGLLLTTIKSIHDRETIRKFRYRGYVWEINGGNK